MFSQVINPIIRLFYKENGFRLFRLLRWPIKEKQKM